MIEKELLNKSNPIESHCTEQEREILSQAESNSVLVDSFKGNFEEEPYHKKLPISFISPKDWQKYLHFTNSINQTDDNEIYLNHRGKHGRILRLFNSFHKLYEEYSVVCTNYLSNGHEDDPTNINKGYRSTCKCSHVDLGKVQKVNKCCQINEEVVENIKKLKNDTNPFGKDSSHAIIWNIKNILKPAKHLKSKLKQLTKESLINLHSVDYFDKIIKCEGDICMNIIEKREQKNFISHKLLLTSNDLCKFKLPDVQYVQLPLAIELLLPKIQIKIEAILNECPFLCDPLEVAAELREFGYDQNACIQYFRTTKLLRSIIEEMMPNSFNNLLMSDNNLRSTSSSVLSTQSHNQLYQDKTDNSNEAITALNSNQNHTNVNNHHSSRQGNVSVDKIFSVVKDLVSFNVDKKSFFNKDLKYSSADCNTQTSMVHFYMDDKNLEQFFRNVRFYLTAMRQIHFETKEEVNFLQKQLCCVFSSLKSYIALLVSHNKDSGFSEEQNSQLMTLSKQVEELKLKLKQEEKRRRHIFNVMQEQMGNIRVYCRCRHIENDVNVIETNGNDSITILQSNERYEFDRIFHPSMSQKDIFEELKPLVMSFIDGYNVCFITYGGEASGKTYTLIGGNFETNQQGLMHRALSTILLEEKVRHRDWDFKVTAGLVEIYNDICIDVLSGENNIHLYVDNGMETAYQKLKSVPITNKADVDALMQVCRMKRKIAKTALNPASSRSHLITLIKLQGRSRIHGENISSFLCLCDLAGFEDIIKAETQTNKILSKEAGYINRSLTAFNRVFVSLKKQDPNTVSYRDSKLTHLLKPFLINSGKCALIVTIRDNKGSLGSTQNTLRFGKESRGVSLGRAKRQVNING